MIPTILVGVVAAERAGASANEFGDSQAGSNDGFGESALGRTASSQRTAETRFRRFRTYGLTPHAKATKRSIADLEYFSGPITSVNWSPSISSRYRQPGFVCCLCSLCCRINDADCFTSISPNTRPQLGRLSR